MPDEIAVDDMEARRGYLLADAKLVAAFGVLEKVIAAESPSP
jgi:hypothetical protein